MQIHITECADAPAQTLVLTNVPGNEQWAATNRSDVWIGLLTSSTKNEYWEEPNQKNKTKNSTYYASLVNDGDADTSVLFNSAFNTSKQ